MASEVPKFHPNPGSSLQPVTSPRTYLLESLTSLLFTSPPSSPWKGPGKCLGIFAGPTSIAYLFLHLSRSHPTLTVQDKTPAEWCATYLSCGQDSTPIDTSQYCGIMNEGLAYRAVLAAYLGDSSTAGTKAVDELLAAVTTLSTPPQFNEWLQGRGGLLALLRIVRAFMPSYAVAVDAVIAPLIDHIMSTRQWTHFGKHLYGAGHGDIGNITQLVLTSPDTAPKLERKLNDLLDRQTERGNWYTSAANDRELVQWCHGAPGFVVCLKALKPYFPTLHNRIDVAVEKAQGLIWAEGMLTKEPNLCHGVHGNSLALEGERKAMFLSVATPEKMKIGLESGWWIQGNDPVGLLWGEAGRAWTWAGMDGGSAGFPGFTDV